MKILLFGASGQIGGFLQNTLAGLGEVVTLKRPEADLEDADTVAASIKTVRPLLVVNAAAYTAVDQAESEPERALRINAAAPAAMARTAFEIGALLIHYSTDYVFDGDKDGAYLEGDRVAPINTYGQSKLLGEESVMESGCDALVLRTSWVYGPRGKNFVHTILRLAAEREQLRIVADQIGAPSSALDLARATASIAAGAAQRIGFGSFRSGVYHLTGAGLTSWHGFATEIVARWRILAPEFPLIVKDIEPIPSSHYPTLARRPRNSALSNQKIAGDYQVAMPHWQDALDECLGSIREDRLAASASRLAS